MGSRSHTAKVEGVNGSKLEPTAPELLTLGATSYFFFYKVLFFFLSFLFLKEREYKAEREGKRESQAGFIHTVSVVPDVGLKPTNREIMT